MQAPPISQAEIDARLEGHVDELLALWWAEQGASKPRDLELMASVLPFSRIAAIRALDLCCGPGDAGRAIRKAYPDAEIDGIDRDPFLTALCRAMNRDERVPGKTLLRDLNDASLREALPGPYDVVATVNALHWFDIPRAQHLLAEAHAVLRDGGIFLLAEPVTPESPFAAGFEAWKVTQPPRYAQENWLRFWSRANAVLGYDHIKLLGSRDTRRVGDELSVAGWTQLLQSAGFASVDVLLRDADQVILAGVKPT